MAIIDQMMSNGRINEDYNEEEKKKQEKIVFNSKNAPSAS